MSISEELRQNRLIYEHTRNGENPVTEQIRETSPLTAPHQEERLWPDWEEISQPAFPELLETVEASTPAMEPLAEPLTAMEYPVITEEPPPPPTDPVAGLLRRWEQEERLLPQNMEVH